MDAEKIQLWQVPLLVMAAISLVEWGLGKALRRWQFRLNRRILGLLGLVAAVLALSALILVDFLSEADKVANVVSAAAAVWTLWRTYGAFQGTWPNDGRPQPPEPETDTR